MGFREPSITEIPEQDLVTQVLSHWYYRELLLNVKGLDSDATALREVDVPRRLRPKGGEIDVLIVPPGAPHEATAIQVKRFPAKVDSTGGAHPPIGHLEDLLKDGIEQANYTSELGFFQVYLWVFILLDTRALNCRQPPPGLSSHIEQAISRRNLDRRVGLMDFDWIQWDDVPLKSCDCGSHLRDLADSAAQPNALTEWVRDEELRRRTEKP